MKLLKTIPFYTFLLVLFFCLHIAQESFGYIPIGDAIDFLLWATLSIGLLFITTWRLTKSLQYAGFSSFVLGACYLYFGAIKSGVSVFGFISRYSFLLPALLALIVLLLVLVKGKNYFLAKVTLFLNVLLIIYCIVDIGIIIQKRLAKTEDVFLNSVQLNLTAVKAKPNVYLLLFDEYAGYESLKRKFNFKNDLLYDQLVKDSFLILPGFANYSITAFCMSSIFNMDYISTIKHGDTVGWHQTKQRMNEIKKAKIFDIFKDLGYSVNNFSLFDVGNQKSSGANKFFQGYRGLLTFNVFHNVVIRDLGWHLSAGANARSWMQEFLMEDLPYYNDHIEAKLFNEDKKDTTPKFTYAHFLMPHPPFLFDSNGVRKPLARHFIQDAWNDKVNYLSYLKYCNKKILSFEQSIVKDDPAAIIILMSDHGVRFDTIPLGPLAFDNFFAIKHTARKQSAPAAKLSNVNIFRYLLNEEFNQKLPYLKDSIVLVHEVDRPK